MWANETIGEYLEANLWLSFCSKMLHGQGTLFGSKKFHLAHPTLKGMSHMAFPLLKMDPVVSQEIPKQHTFHLIKQPDLCWTICTKGIDLATKRAQIQSCRIVSWSFQPLSRLAFVIRSESLEVTVFNHFKELHTTPEKAKFAQTCQVPNLFSDLKKVCSIVKMHAIQSCSCGFLLVFQRLQPHSPCTVTLADRSFYPRLLQVR